MNIAHRILQLCNHYNITPNKLAAMADVPSSTMQSIVGENTGTTTVATIEKICAALNITLSDFFEEKAVVDLPAQAQYDRKLFDEFLHYKYNNPGK